AFVQAGVQAGYPYTEDMNGFQQEGVGPMFRTTKDGKRWSTANAYLRGGVMQRPNLEVITRAYTKKILFDGKMAVGVEIDYRQARHRVEVHREVLLCAGAINSPQILMLSGIGPREQMR